jgi:hypothetical protein
MLAVAALLAAILGVFKWTGGAVIIGMHGKLKCKNKKCGHILEVLNFNPGMSYLCPYCDYLFYYRTSDLIRETYPKE